MTFLLHLIHHRLEYEHLTNVYEEPFQELKGLKFLPHLRANRLVWLSAVCVGRIHETHSSKKSCFILTVTVARAPFKTYILIRLYYRIGT